LALMVGGFYLSGRQQFSDSYLRNYLLEHTANVYQGNNESACEVFDDDAVVSIEDSQPDSQQEVEGGKNQVCGYIKQTSASYAILGVNPGSLISVLDKFEVIRSDFPWMTAQVSYQQKSTIKIGEGPQVMSSYSDGNLTLKRTLLGLRITRLEAKGYTTME
jgi:hypothetical protein